MNHIRDIIETVMALRKSQSALYNVDTVLTELQVYKYNPEIREEIWDAIKTTAELLDKIDVKKEINNDS